MRNLNQYLKGLLLPAIVLLHACSTINEFERPKTADSQKETVVEQDEIVEGNNDGPPLLDRDVSMIPNAIPKHEPYSRYGNPANYEVFGERYHVMDKSHGYSAKGTASWYGRKFHGNKTSSGEPYDMFAMTAAHRSLPLPTYAKVKNLDNGKEVIVKINDRGPFVKDRLIDLSYAAAKKLGLHHTGTAKVHITAIDAKKWELAEKTKTSGKPIQVAQQSKTTAKTSAKKSPAASKSTTVAKSAAPVKSATLAANKNLYIQLGSFSEKSNAQNLADRAVTLSQALTKSDVKVMPHKSSNKEIYQVRIGPLKNKEQAQKIQKQLVALQKPNSSTLVYE